MQAHTDYLTGLYNRCHFVEQASIAVREGVPVRVTVSIRLSHLNGSEANFDTLLSEADRAMYVAKESGRNRIVVGEQSRK